jgi:hypothetical protein
MAALCPQVRRQFQARHDRLIHQVIFGFESARRESGTLLQYVREPAIQLYLEFS